MLNLVFLLDAADSQGFAAFGRLVSMDVVRKIHKQPKEGQKLQPSIKIISVVRLKDIHQSVKSPVAGDLSAKVLYFFK